MTNLKGEPMFQTLPESENICRDLLEGIGVGILVAQAQTRRFIFANSTMCALLGYSVDEYRRLTVNDLHPAADLPRVLSEFEAQARGEKLLAANIPCLHKDGRLLHVDIHANSKMIGDLPCVVGVFSDVTARWQTEAALRESELRLRALSDNMPGSMVYQVDTGDDGLDRRFTYLSAGVEAMHGIPMAVAIQDSSWVYNQVNPDDLPAFQAAERQAVASMRPFSFEVRVRLPDGDLRWRLFASAPRRLLSGKLIWDGIEVDITEGKRAEEDKVRLESQLRQAQKLESVGRLAGGVAHDFNNMLGVILGHAQLAMEQIEPSHQLYSDLEEIRLAANRSADLTRQLLAFARKQTIVPQVLQLNETVARTHNMLRRLIGENIELVFEPGDPLWPVRMDPSQVEQILANLCVNARDAIHGVGRILISTQNCIIDEAFCELHSEARCGDFVRIAVTDTGCGMAPETVAQIFEPFFTTKEFGHGTGLGLAMVYGAIQQNHGFILVESSPGNGTTFQLHLPREGGVPAAAGSSADPIPPHRLCRETILLAEDERGILNITHRMLSQQGYLVLAARTPQEALRIAREHPKPIDLLVTDVIMPEMNGRTLAGELIGLHPGLRCLFISGYTADILAHQEVLEDGVAFLQKPFTPQVLLGRVREILDRPPGGGVPA